MGWQYFGTGITSNRTMDQLERDLQDQWQTETTIKEPAAGTPFTLITLTTCEDLFHSPDRSIAFGHLINLEKKR